MGDEPPTPVTRTASDAMAAWAASLTPEERAALLARLGPPEPWEQEGGIVSGPDADEERFRAAWRRRLRKSATENESAPA